jgi:hypothetical protein
MQTFLDFTQPLFIPGREKFCKKMSIYHFAIFVFVCQFVKRMSLLLDCLETRNWRMTRLNEKWSNVNKEIA